MIYVNNDMKSAPRESFSTMDLDLTDPVNPDQFPAVALRSANGRATAEPALSAARRGEAASLGGRPVKVKRLRQLSATARGEIRASAHRRLGAYGRTEGALRFTPTRRAANLDEAWAWDEQPSRPVP